jgi:hypothetical protein
MRDLFDAYSLRARMGPFALVLAPLLLALWIWQPQLFDLITGVSSVVLTVAVSMVCGHMVREMGKRREPALWSMWDGPPATRFLRHRDRKIDDATKARWHALGGKLLGDVTLPNKRQESANPEKADQTYTAIVKALRSRTRDVRQFPLVFRENVLYGFLRNMLGLKPVGVVTSLIALAAVSARAGAELTTAGQVSDATIVGAFASVSLALVWTAWIRPNAVKVAAEAYAERLLETLDSLSKSSSGGPSQPA